MGLVSDGAGRRPLGQRLKLKSQANVPGRRLRLKLRRHPAGERLRGGPKQVPRSSPQGPLHVYPAGGPGAGQVDAEAAVRLPIELLPVFRAHLAL